MIRMSYNKCYVTLACGFPTTVNPIITNRLIPVFVDIDLEDLSLAPEIFEDAIKKDKKIKKIMKQTK